MRPLLRNFSARATISPIWRSLAENQNRPDWEIPDYRLRERSHRCCSTVPREAGREGPSLHWEGRDRLVPETVSSQIRKKLDTVVSPKTKLTKPIKKPKAVWDEPSFFTEIEYRDITSEGLLRQSSLKGLRRNEVAATTFLRRLPASFESP
jgi:hypothetical protein